MTLLHVCLPSTVMAPRWLSGIRWVDPRTGFEKAVAPSVLSAAMTWVHRLGMRSALRSAAAATMPLQACSRSCVAMVSSG